MDLIQLERFIAVAAAGSLRKAALQLGLSQPTLTWSIRQLETSVSGQLFERHGRGSRLTPAGHELLPHAQLLINAGKRAISAVATLQGARDPELTVAASTPFMVNVIPRAIEAALAKLPRLRVQLVQAEGRELLEGLRNGEFDVAFGNPLKNQDLTGLDHEKIYTERYAPAARAGHPIFRQRGPIGLATLAQYGWASFRNSLSHQPQESPFTRAGLPLPVVRSEVSSEHLLRPILLGTDLIGYVAVDLIAQELRQGRIRTIDVPGLSVNTSAGLLVRQDASYTPAMKTFCREVRRVCRELKSPPP